MRAQDKPLIEILSNPKIRVIPIFQRNYSWEKDQFERLWSDIENIRPGRFLFLGTIMEKEKNGQLWVIDGQQRLTTLYIILSILRDLSKESNHDQTSDEIQDRFLINRYQNGDAKYKLISKTPDHSLLKEIADGRGPFIPNTDNSLHRKAYQYFRSQIKAFIAHDEKRLIELRDRILNQIKVIHAELDQNDNEFIIFECLNATGLQLSPSDLIRNAIMMRLDNATQEDHYAQYWLPIENKADKILEAVGGSKFTKRSEVLDDFFFNYLKSYGYLSKDNIYKEFNNKFEDKHTPQEKIIFLEEINRYFDHYASLFLTTYNFKDEEARLLWRIYHLNVTVCYPFIITLRDEKVCGNITEELYLELLATVENMVVRMLLAGEKTNGLNKIFIEYAKKLRDKEITYSKYLFTLRFDYPTDEQIKQAILGLNAYKGIKSALIPIFQAIEDHLATDYDEKIAIDPKSYHIEHVLPQKGYKDNGYSISDEDFNRLINTFGNITMIRDGNNISAGNKPFRNKQEDNYSKSNLKINRFFKNFDKWNAQSILARTEHLSDILLKIYPYIANPKSKTESLPKPIKLVVGSKEFAITSYADGLRKLIKYVEKEVGSDALSTHNNMQKYIYNHKPTKFRTEKLENGSYFNNNFSSKDIVHKISKDIETVLGEPVEWVVE